MKKVFDIPRVSRRISFIIRSRYWANVWCKINRYRVYELLFQGTRTRRKNSGEMDPRRVYLNRLGDVLPSNLVRSVFPPEDPERAPEPSCRVRFFVTPGRPGNFCRVRWFGRPEGLSERQIKGAHVESQDGAYLYSFSHTLLFASFQPTGLRPSKKGRLHRCRWLLSSR